VFPTLIANAYLVGDAASWVLVDTCAPGHERRICSATENRFGPSARPRAIILTHGHFDHAGSAAALADLWNVPIYAHTRELAFLTGQAHYPPMDYWSPGFFTLLARFFPTSTVDLSSRVRPFEAGPVPGLETWQMLDTPGHTPGHVSFFRPKDAVLLAGDAVTTMNLDSFFATICKRKQVCRPPVPATSDWLRARESVRLLARLRPNVIAAGHGEPIHGAADGLHRLADAFQIPVLHRQSAAGSVHHAAGPSWMPLRIAESGHTARPPERAKRVSSLLQSPILSASGSPAAVRRVRGHPRPAKHPLAAPMRDRPQRCIPPPRDSPQKIEFMIAPKIPLRDNLRTARTVLNLLVIRVYTCQFPLSG